jgi:TetR/AcrR family transcriptional regulator, repressor for neighboring sulfatase
LGDWPGGTIMTKTPKEPAAPENGGRGRKNVEAKLIRAACALLSKRGPRALTVREIAQHAGVNHGQVHHYFKGKKVLLTAAMRTLAREHWENTAARDRDEHDVPPPLALAQDQEYILAVIRCVVDGEMDLATLELEDGISVPRRIVNELIVDPDFDYTPAQVKAVAATFMTAELSWAVFGQYILKMIDADAAEAAEVEAAIARTSRIFLDNPDLLV